MRSLIQSEARRAFFSAVVAFIIWGSWALIAHWDYAIWVKVKAGVTQGMSSFTFTYIGTIMLERLFRVGKTPLTQVLISGLGTFGIVLSSVLVIHTLAGTPEMLLTIAPSMTVSFFYCLSYAAALRKLDNMQLQTS